MPLSEQIISQLQSRLRTTSISILHQVQGGCIAKSFAVSVGKQKFFIKTAGEHTTKGLFAAEAEGLQLLSNHGLHNTPEVIDVCDDYLLLEWVELGEEQPSSMSIAGKNLAMLHSRQFPYFGLERNNFIGSLVQQNEISHHWPQFYFHQRLMPAAEIALARGGIFPLVVRELEMLYPKLNEIIPDESPSLLHGDLWGGNLIFDSNGVPYFIDPAVYGGHREVDLAMTMLFGGFSKAFYEAYYYHFPLLPDFRSRISLYKLYPLLVHAALFGLSYADDCRRCISAYL